jgi:hypothetical protein
MDVFISIDGVLRNTVQKLDYHYKDAFLNSEFENEVEFEYNVIEPINNNDLLSSYKFQSVEEYENFLFIEYPIEIFGHAGLSYSNTFSELNKIIYKNPEINFTIIGLNEFGKAKPATLFFLSKNGFLGNNIKFSKIEDIPKLWEQCDLWITDNKDIIDLCPTNKKVIKFNTDYNKFFTYNKEITKLSEIQELWQNCLEEVTT